MSKYIQKSRFGIMPTGSGKRLDDQKVSLKNFGVRQKTSWMRRVPGFQAGAVALQQSSARNQREFYRPRPSIIPKGGYCTIRKRQSVSLTLSDHPFNLAYQELLDLLRIIDLAAAFEKFPSDLLRLCN
jgi:hypothetical protein